MHPTELACLQELLKRLQDRHVDCAEAVAKKAAVDAASAATVDPDASNVLQAMMQLQQAKSRAEAANKLALESEKERDTAEKAVEELIVSLIKTLGLTELVSDALATRKQKEAETNAKIVDLFKEALDEIKNCRTEQQRVEFHIALACVMPPREAQDSKTG